MSDDLLLTPVAYVGDYDEVVAEGHSFKKDYPVLVPADTARALLNQAFVLLDDSLVVIDTPELEIVEYVPVLVVDPGTVGLLAVADLGVIMRDGTDYTFVSGQVTEVHPDHVETLMQYDNLFAHEGDPLPLLPEPLVEPAPEVDETVEEVVSEEEVTTDGAV